MKICFNGKFIEETESMTVSPFFDFAQFGYSVFETLRTYDSTHVFEKELHLDRLEDSLKILNFPQKIGLRRSEISESLDLLVQKNQLVGKDLRIKIFLCEEFYWIKTQGLDPFSEKNYETGVEICDQVYERSFPRAKYANPAYPFFRKMQPESCFETIFFNESGFLREGNISNVFVVFGEKIVTPHKNILEGITREKVLETAQKLGMKVEEREVSRVEMQQADGIFLTNTTKEVLPVRKWNDWSGDDFSMAHLLRSNFSRNG